MFTGIVDHCGEIVECRKIPAGIFLRIRTQFDDLVLGESIAVDGICLTVTEIFPDALGFEISPETLQLTTAKNFKINTRVNLERSLSSKDRFGGHVVMGHVDTVATFISKENQGDFIKATFQADKKLWPYFVKKGSVALNGVSLTINHVEQDTFEVMLIPHTLSRTNLSNLMPGDFVNLECDYFARYLIHYLENVEKTQ